MPIGKIDSVLMKDMGIGTEYKHPMKIGYILGTVRDDLKA